MANGKKAAASTHVKPTGGATAAVIARKVVISSSGVCLSPAEVYRFHAQTIIRFVAAFAADARGRPDPVCGRQCGFRYIEPVDRLIFIAQGFHRLKRGHFGQRL